MPKIGNGNGNVRKTKDQLYDISKMRIFGDICKLSKVGKMLSNNKNNAIFSV